MKTIYFLLISLLSINAFASEVYENYFADGLSYKLIKKEGDDFLIGYANFLKKLNKCEEHYFKYYNPLIRKEGYYEIKGYDNNECLLKINYNNLREIKCSLNIENIQKIIEGRIDLIRKKDGFGQLSQKEIEVYYQDKKCNIENIEKKIDQKEIDLFNKKLKEENPEIYEFIINNK